MSSPENLDTTHAPAVGVPRFVRGQAVIGDTVEWFHTNRHGTTKHVGVVTGEDPRRGTHLRIRTQVGTRYVMRAHLITANTEVCQP
jgi:hypothetical protein